MHATINDRRVIVLAIASKNIPPDRKAAQATSSTVLQLQHVRPRRTQGTNKARIGKSQTRPFALRPAELQSTAGQQECTNQFRLV